MSKERLEEAKNAIKEIDFIENQKEFKHAGIAKAYFTEKYGVWLIEQTERVKELEELKVHYTKQIQELTRWNDDGIKENKHYRNGLKELLKSTENEFSPFFKVTGRWAIKQRIESILAGDQHERER